MLCHGVFRATAVLFKSSFLCQAKVPLTLLVRESHSDATTTYTDVHDVEIDDKLDQHLQQLVCGITLRPPMISTLHHQYQDRAGAVIDRIIPYQETLQPHERAEFLHLANARDELQGDGLVLVVHAQLEKATAKLLKTTVSSGFVVDASISKSQQGDTIVTCAHTLEEIYRHLQYSAYDTDTTNSFSLIIPPSGPARMATKVLSSIPRSDVVVLEVEPSLPAPRLRPLPLTPFPVYPGTPILTHLFGSPDPPTVQHSIARTRNARPFPHVSEIEKPQRWPTKYAWRRWGVGTMLGYRSYTGLELEAGISNVLPHILTSILPTSGSSGGPLVNGETGCVVGMTSGRRMDNRVEGERGWGCSSEGIFEMFSLPGFMPSNK